MPNTIKYPNITVQLTGNDGNAFAIMGATTRAMKLAKVSPEEINAYREQAMSGDYDHLLQVTMEWVNVE